jgi:hypothetical protein
MRKWSSTRIGYRSAREGKKERDTQGYSHRRYLHCHAPIGVTQYVQSP